MSVFRVAVVVLLLCATTFAAVSKQPQGGEKSRVVDENLSKSPHEVDGVHNPAYDREALFGEESKQLDSASPEDRLTQLGILADKMDEDRDGYVAPEELRVWLKKVHQHLANTDARKTWAEYELSPTDTLSWEHYSRHMVGEDGEYEGEDEETRTSHLTRDKRRWDVADTNQDGILSIEESVAFFNPESDPKMHDVMVKETIEDMDKNHDGFVDLEEYIADFWRPSGNEQEPEWVKSEREEFQKRRDFNQDGKLDEAEVKAWILPSDYDYNEAEVQHLLSECDVDKDGRLSKSEILSKHELLVGSSATNYGEALTDHDEL
ncbi:Calumenin precursor [Paragonimus heterotremus]|uniref:Reticulocalbin-3 n=1 Tax=Paragonimus heterotremus TaxID=100268 RepID=A0A8J4SPR2_9TREM|nr:Calumenin precursor [Paragonimus heterotremus]